MGEFLSEDVNMQNEDGITVLMLAAENGETETVQLLIDNGANIYHKNNNGKTALDMVEGETLKKIIQMIENIDMGLYFSKLLERVSVKEFQNVYRKMVNMLLERNQQYFEYEAEVDEFGKTALMRALENKQDNLAVYLMMKGARLNCEDNYGKSVFRYILENGNLGILKLCLEKKFDDYSKYRVIDILVNRKVYENEGLKQALDMIDLEDASNLKVIKECRQNGVISDDAAKLLESRLDEIINKNKKAHKIPKEDTNEIEGPRGKIRKIDKKGKGID